MSMTPAQAALLATSCVDRFVQAAAMENEEPQEIAAQLGTLAMTVILRMERAIGRPGTQLALRALFETLDERRKEGMQ